MPTMLGGNNVSNSKFISLLESKVMPVANKVGNQKHLLAIRNGVISTLPLTIIGSFFVILLNMPIPGYDEFIASFKNILDIPFRFTVGAMGLYVAFGVAYSLAGHYKIDQLSSGLLAVLAFLITSVVPIHVTDSVNGVIEAGRYINIGDISASSLFGAIITSILSVEIIRFFLERNIRIKLPESVPENVSNSFSALIPSLFIILLFWIVRHIINFDLNSTITWFISPLKDVLVGNSLLGGMLTVFLILIFWVLGIHGPGILAPITRPLWDASIIENMEIFAETGDAYNLPTIFTEQFLQWFIWIGGAGTTLSLVVLFMFSKAKFLKDLGRLTFIPGLFNINEPIIFGAPIVMNPILAIPFIVAPLVNLTIAYITFKLGLIPLMMAKLPFTVPAPLGAIISTDWSIAAGVLVCINFFVGIVIYYPFFKMFEKQHLKMEEDNLNEMEESS